MKNRLILLLLLISTFTFGQKTFNNFEGKLLFKDVHYFEPFTREIIDTTINYYSYIINSNDNRSEIKIGQLFIVKNDLEEYSFVKFTFIRRHDSLFINYRNPYENREIHEYIYPLNKRDTVTNLNGYSICVDSILNFDHTYLKTIDFCNNGPVFNSTYIKDTTIIFKDHSFDCYAIQQNYNSFRNQILLRKNIYIDKSGLFPVYEDEWIFAKRSLNRVPLDSWVRTRQMKLILLE